MPEETKKPLQNPSILKKEWIRWFSIASLVAAFITLLFPMFDSCVKEDGVKVYQTMYLWDLFKDSLTATSIVAIIMIALLLMAIPLMLFGKRKNLCCVAASIALFIAAVLMLLIPRVYYSQTGCHSVDIAFGLTLSFAFSVIAAVFALGYSYKKMPMTIRDMSEDAVLIASAFALNFIKIPMGVTGGSINFQMLPLFIIALRHGPLQGLIGGGIVFGAITCFTDGYGIVTFPFDYLIGFGSVSILGFFKNLIMNEEKCNFKGILFIVIGVTLAGVVRMIGGIAGSMVVYSYGFLAAIVYNASYIPPSIGASLIMLILLYGPLLKLNNRFSKNAAEIE